MINVKHFVSALQKQLHVPVTGEYDLVMHKIIQGRAKSMNFDGVHAVLSEMLPVSVMFTKMINVILKYESELPKPEPTPVAVPAPVPELIEPLVEPLVVEPPVVETPVVETPVVEQVEQTSAELAGLGPTPETSAPVEKPKKRHARK